MKKKLDNIYQNAGAILDRMIANSSKSQSRFAREDLGINGVNISTARKTMKIPDRWFEIVFEKYGVTKEELCNPPDEADRQKPDVSYEQAMNELISHSPTLTRQFESQMENFFKSVKASFTNPQSTKPNQAQNPLASPFDAEMNRFFELIKEWWAEERGNSPQEVDEFREEFKDAFPAMKDWLKKRGVERKRLE